MAIASPPPIAIRGTGLVSSVGLSAPAACAALRAKLTNPSETRFRSQDGPWLMAHEVPLDQAWRGRAKLARMAAMAIDEALADLPSERWAELPLLLCVAERERPGRQAGLDDALLREIEALLGTAFAPGSAVVAHGRVGAAVALASARRLIHEQGMAEVVIAATDSLLSWPTLSAYEQADRLLTERNSNGFLPGEGAGAVRVGAPQPTAELRCTGIGFAIEKAALESGEPLRAEGLSQAITQALAEAQRAMHEIDYRITDLSGEQYYFKEAALALSRTLRQRKEAFDLWHPAECTGETGAVAGLAILALADAACRKGYSLGPRILAHMANDAGPRAALVLDFGSAP